MKNLLKPYWILLTVTLPQLVMFSIYLANYQIIKSLLSSSHLWYWTVYGLLFGLSCLAATGYGLWAMAKKAKISAYYGFIALAFYVPLLYFFMQDQSSVLPGNIPNWMLTTGDLSTYANTFVMPAIFHSLWVLVLFFTPNERERHSWWNFVIVVAIPVTWYVIFTVVLPVVNHGISGQLMQHIRFLFFASSTVVFFFFLMRGIYIVSSKKNGFWTNGRNLLWQIPVFLVFPVLGLYLNDLYDSIFGNFAAPEFYILAIVNGLLIIIPNGLVKDHRLQLLLFAARSVTFSYILYFFLVFLPLLPFSILAIIIVGAGFLMLSPLFITIFQANLLWRSFRELRQEFSPYILTWTLVLGLAALPISIAYSYKQDRKHLHRALELVYAPDLSRRSDHQQRIDPERLQRVLANVRKNKNTRQNTRWLGWNEKQKPYLSAYYQWAVLDNLTLGEQKLDDLERIFLGKTTQSSSFSSSRFRVAPMRSDLVKIDSFEVQSTYVQKGQYWRTWVHLDIKNPTSLQQEYATKFKLPAGTWISNYYLMIGKHKEYGILSEKKAAMWVYNNIVSRRRDPGILHYTEGNEVAFKVFPFAAGQTRRTGIEFVHKEPVTFKIGNQVITLGKSQTAYALNEVKKTDDGLYIPALVKNKAPLKNLKPALHFVIDASQHSAQSHKRYIQQIKKYLKQHADYKNNAKITVANFHVQTFEIDAQNKWEQKVSNTIFEGGFFLEGALKQIFMQQRRAENEYPAVIVVSNNFSKAIFKHSMANFKQELMGTKHYYTLQAGGSLNSHSLFKKPLEIVDKEAKFPGEIKLRLINNDVLVEDDNHASFYTNETAIKVNPRIKDNLWENASILWAYWKTYQLHPTSSYYLSPGHHIDIIQGSFRTGIMTPLTSYISLENEAQKAALLAKQKQVLSGNPLLDAGEELTRMSEPSLWLLLGLIGVAFLARNYWKKRRLSVN